MNDSLLPNLFRTLELVVVERMPYAGFFLLTPAPDWLRAVLDAAPPGAQSSLSGAMPFLEHFLEQADAVWKEGDAIAGSGPFTATVAGQEQLLTATALTLQERKLLIIGRLSGLADTRPILQKAREQMLEHEQVVRQISAARFPAEAVHHGLEDLMRTSLTADQLAIVERIRQSSSELQTAMSALPAQKVRQRRKVKN